MCREKSQPNNREFFKTREFLNQRAFNLRAFNLRAFNLRAFKTKELSKTKSILFK